jgi:hypothetical protein
MFTTLILMHCVKYTIFIDVLVQFVTWRHGMLIANLYVFGVLMRFSRALSYSWLIYASFCLPLALAEGPSVGGGNGSVVYSPHSQKLVLWDLYLANPALKDNYPGDQIQVSERGRPRLARYIDYREFQTFKWLRSRLNAWKTRIPHFYEALNAEGFLDTNGLPVLYIKAVIKHIAPIDEIFVPDGFESTTVELSPLGFYRPDQEDLFIDASLWNRSGFLSQAATLLHERVRQLQTNFEISNENLQELVAILILNGPSSRKNLEALDQLFAPEKRISNERPDIQGYINEEQRAVQEYMHKRFMCSRDVDVKKCVQKNKLSNVVWPSLKTTPALDPVDASVSVEMLNAAAPFVFAARIFSDRLIKFTPHSRGAKNKAVDTRGEVLVEPLTCPRVKLQHSLPQGGKDYDNICPNQNWFGAVSGFQFAIPDPEEFTIEIEVFEGSPAEIELYVFASKSAEDGFPLKLKETRVFENSYDAPVVVTAGDALIEQKTIRINRAKQRTYRFHFSHNEVEVLLADDGNGNSIPLARWNLALKQKGRYWSFSGDWMTMFKKVVHWSGSISKE